MKRSSAFILAASIASMIGGYAAWCARPFYLNAQPPHLSNLPEPVRKVILPVIESSDLIAPEPFRIDRLVDLLARPFSSSPHQVALTQSSPDIIIISRNNGQRWIPLVFGKNHNGWHQVTEQTLQAEQIAAPNGP